MMLILCQINTHACMHANANKVQELVLNFFFCFCFSKIQHFKSQQKPKLPSSCPLPFHILSLSLSAVGVVQLCGLFSFSLEISILDLFEFQSNQRIKQKNYTKNSTLSFLDASPHFSNIVFILDLFAHLKRQILFDSFTLLSFYFVALYQQTDHYREYIIRSIRSSIHVHPVM